MRSPFVGLSLCLPLSLLTGCSGDDGPAAPTTSSSTTDDPTAADATSTTVSATESTSLPGTEDSTLSPPDTDTGGPIAGCECIIDEVPADPNSVPAAPTCGDAICPLVASGCGDEFCDLGGPFMLDDPAALECALVALRDRTPGLVTWSYSEGSGSVTQDGYLLIGEGVTVVWRDWIREGNFTVSDAVLGELPPPATYEACLADPNDLGRFSCLADPLATQFGVCDESWECMGCS